MEYTFNWNGSLIADMVQSFKDYGFFIARGFLDRDEVKNMLCAIEEPEGILKFAYKENGITWTHASHPGNDVTGMFARSKKVVDTCEKLLESEVYHWCSHCVLKEPRTGGGNAWHQDYGYWYEEGCQRSTMVTVWTPLDPATRENGCKQVLVSSHKLGRFQHIPVQHGQKTIPDDDIEVIKTTCPLVYLEMQPGDVFIHDSNLVHKSAPNRSAMRRWAFMSCYNAASNSPVVDTEYPRYTMLDKVDNDMIRTCTNYTDMSSKGFLNGLV